MDNFKVFTRIVDNWLVDHIGIATGKNGSKFYSIDFRKRFDFFLILIDELKTLGFTRDSLEGRSVYSYLQDLCTPHGVTSKKRKSWFDKTAQDWRNALKEKYRSEIEELKFNPDEVMEEPLIFKNKVVEDIEEYIPLPDKVVDTGDAIAYEPTEEDKNKPPVILDKEMVELFGYTEEQIDGIFGKVTYV